MTVIEEIDAERKRHIDVEGWTEAHDDQHDTGELASAAASYAIAAAYRVISHDDSKIRPSEYWPWGAVWWKPTTARQCLIKAASLIVAEIERLDRRKA